ncbi:MAG: fatty acid synthase [Hyphomicrobiales bacterium]|nr:MAG: fatty acid synthase [Hyphomicrobiales bacterium]
MNGDKRDIAIIGYACRLPSAPNPDAFWSTLIDGRCAIGSISSDRWAPERFGHPNRTAAGKSYTWAAGQLDDVWGFDPGFFGISPREAAQMDPQQRLLLQVVWEALENAGIPASKLAGSETGVYVGTSSLDYGNGFLFDPAAADVQLMTGNTLSIVANRVSYIFDLRGPSFVVDTACSSSLVALHEALEAIRAGHIDTAIVAGVHLLLSPFAFVGFSRASMLSSTGLCRAFDADGDGYVRSEGSVAFVIRAADVAEKNGDRIHGLLVGSGINSDGRTVGLSLPSPMSQAALLDKVYDEYAIDPNGLAFVEAHGTGTRVGDPAETEALGTILGQKRKSALPIGSVKTNIGHLEPVSGLAGLLKAVMALEHDVLPPSLHFETPNPDIPFDKLNLEVVTKPRKLPRGKKPRYAGVNSFGFGGTNAHAILRDPDPVKPPRAVKVDERAPLIISAQSPEALTELAAAYRERIDAADETMATGIVNAAAYNRDRLDRRLLVLGAGKDAKLAGLDAFIAGEKSPDVVEARTVTRSTPVAFLFSGNGSQWAGMAQAAYQNDTDFRRAFEHVDRRFMSVSGWSLLTMLFSPELENEIERTEIAQPLLFGVQVAIVEALRKRGLNPTAVAGHSVGEVAAAWCAGALDLDQAVKVIHARSTHQEVARHLGTMAALLLGEEAAREAIDDPRFKGLELAAVNSPRSVTISGPVETIDAFAKYARKQRWALRKLNLDYPFHCALIDSIEAPLKASLEDLKPHAGKVAFVSSVKGVVLDGTKLGTDYWWDNVREAVHFEASLKTLNMLGHRVFVEIGPRPVLTTYVNDTYRALDESCACLPALDKDDADKADPIGRIVALALAAGGQVDDAALFGKSMGPPIDLPYYPWQNQEFRIGHTDENFNFFGGDSHPLLGFRIRPESAEWFNHVDDELIPLLADHKVEDAVVFPAAGYIEMALAAGTAWLGTDQIEIQNMDIIRPLVIDHHGTRETMLQISSDGTVFDLMSRARLSGDEWSLHCRGLLRKLPSAAPKIAEPSGSADSLGADALYRITEQFGLNYGDAFRRAAYVDTFDERTARVAFSPATDLTAESGYLLDPTLLDSVFHGLFALLRQTGETPANTSFLPVRIGALRLYKTGVQADHGIIRVTRASPRSIEATFELVDADGELTAVLEGTRFRAVPLARTALPDELVYRTASRRLGRPGEPSALAEACPSGLLALAGKQGHVSDDEHETGEDWLLLEASVRSIAQRTLLGIAGKESAAFEPIAAVADGRLAENAHAFAVRLLMALEDTGLAEETDGVWSIADDADQLGADDILRTVIADHPARIAEVSLLAHLGTALPGLLRNGLAESADKAFSGSLLEHLVAGSPSFVPAIDALADTVASLADAWPKAMPLRILQVGALNERLTRAIANRLDADFATLTVTDTDSHVLERAKVRAHVPRGTSYATLEEIAEHNTSTGGFDLIVAANAFAGMDDQAITDLAVNLAPGGGLLAAEPAPGIMFDALFGVGADWWETTVDPAYPVSAIRGAADWADLFDGTGFAGVETASMAISDSEGLLISATVADSAKAAKAEAKDEAKDDADDKPLPLLVLLADEEGLSRAFADGLASSLEQMGRTVITAVPGDKTASVSDNEWTYCTSASDDENKDSLAGLLAADGPRDLVYFAGIGGSEEAPLDAVATRTTDLTVLLQALGIKPARLWIVAPGAMQHVAGSSTHRPVEAAVWGYGRVAANEYPNAEIRLVDISPALQPGEASSRLAAEIAAPGEEHEIIIDADRRTGLRIAHGGVLPAPEEFTGPEENAGYRLDIARQGSLDELVWRRVERKEPTGTEVEITMAASGLNFRDVMWSLGLLPEEALEDGFAGPTLGMEGAGIITRVGPDATRLKPGDHVLTFAPACFASHVTVDERACAPMPSTVSLEEAATIPVTFLTAYYALVYLAHLEEGESVLIHGGAGGVGLAALQIAKWRGATVFTTAGTDEKRDFVRMLGADHVLDSRSLSFADEILALTDGKGVDVVLNSLSGEAMERSIDVLKPFGRFLELGKRDYYANTRIGLRPFRQNLSYFGIDADQLLTRQPKLADRIFGDLVGLFESGVLTPLPYRVFAGEDATHAFRLMQKSGHIGKIILTPPKEQEEREAVEPLALKADATYAIIGGLGGFGLETARWLVGLGARNLVLTSRRGAANEEIAAEIADIEKLGAKVVVEACDVADEKATKALFAKLAKDMPPVRGVLHTAMVLDDALISNLDGDRISTVLAPKVAGAYVLDQVTRGLDLDLFVLFSSATTIVGNPGQANYVAANAYLEALADKRRAEGLPALAVAWGAIGDAGYLARNAEVNEMLSRKLGRHMLAAKDALDGLERLLTHYQGGAAAFAHIDWSSARKELVLLKTPLFADIAADIDAESSDAGGDVDLHALIAGLDRVQAIDTISKLLAGEIARILRLPAEEVDRHRPLAELGMDSLMALELRMAAEQRLGIDIPLMSIANGATLSDIAGRVTARVLGEEGESGLSDTAESLYKQHVGEVTADGQTVAAIAEAVEEKSQSVRNMLK